MFIEYTEYFDFAQVAVYLFWFFFAGLIIYLRREDKREGYPLEADRGGRVEVQGFPPVPPKRPERAKHPALVNGGGEAEGPTAPGAAGGRTENEPREEDRR